MAERTWVNADSSPCWLDAGTAAAEGVVLKPE